MATSITEMIVREFMTDASELKAVQKSDTLEKAIPLLINGNVHHVAVFDRKEFIGFFGYKQLARLNRRPVHQTRVGEYIIKPPALSPDSGIVDAAESMYRLNYKILPVFDNKKLAGVISERDILRAAINTGELNGRSVEDFMTPAPVIIKSTDRLGAAISVLRDKSISRLPVVDESGMILGVFESTDVMREMYTNESSYGAYKTSSVNSQKGSVTANAPTDDQMPAYKIAVKALMKDTPIVARENDALLGPLKDAISRNMTSVIVVDGKNRPVGIVVPKDIIQHIARKKQKEALYIQISGLESEPMPDFEKDEVHRMIDDTGRKLAKAVKLQFFTMHFKSYSTEAKKRKYSIRCRAGTDIGLYATREYGWDIIDATSRALETFEKLVIGKKQKVTTKMMERNRNKKNARNETTKE